MQIVALPDIVRVRVSLIRAAPKLC